MDNSPTPPLAGSHGEAKPKQGFSVSKWLKAFVMTEGGPHAAALIGWLTIIFGSVGLVFASGIICAFQRWSVAPFAYIGLTSLGATVAGFFIGFLFGIPKVLQMSPSEEKGPGYEQRVNTNLEQISDWLTKILVGVGLVEMNQAPAFLWKVSTKLSQAYSVNGTPTPSAIPIVCAALVYFSILGLISGYLITRLYFAAVFAQADQRALVNKGAASASVDASALPPSAMKILPPEPVELSDNAKAVLATLARYQKELFGMVDERRWTFTISPAATDYSGFLKGTGELLEQNLVLVNPANGHVMLSNNGLEYVSKYAADLGEVFYGPFGADRPSDRT